MLPLDQTDVRRLSLTQASKLAVSIAVRAVATFDGNGWIPNVAEAATPDPIDPRPIGKTPSRWVVRIEWSPADGRDAVLDGGPFAIVDLVTKSVDWR
jgi:hypothetical protein